MNPPILDLAYCETRVLLLHPGRLYRFTPHSDCPKCMTLMRQHDAAMGGEPSKTLDTSEPKEHFAYSYDQVEYWGHFDSRGDAVAECMSEADLDTGLTQTVWTGRVRHATSYMDQMNAQRIGQRIVEELDEQLAEDIASDDELLTMSCEQEEALGLLVLDFVKNNAQFNRWGVDKIEEHTGVKE